MADITMPQLGETVTEGTITRWLKQVGDSVAEDEVLFEVSTDKVDSEVPSPAAGVLSEILVAEGDTVDVGTRLAVISDGNAAPAPAQENDAADAADAGGSDEAAAEADESGAVDESEPDEESAPEPEPEPVGVSASASPSDSAERNGASTAPSDRRSGGRFADSGKVLSPVVRRLLTEHDLDPAQIEGSGAGGRITRSDVLALIDQRSNGTGKAPNASTATATAPAPASARSSSAGGSSPAPASAGGTSTAPASARSSSPAPTGPSAPASGRPSAAPATASTPARAATAAEPFPASIPGERDTVVPFTNIRRRTAEHMVRSKATSAHAMVAVEVDYSGVDKVRAAQRSAFKEAEGFSLTYLPFISRAVVDVLRDFPNVNSSVGDDALIVHQDINLGIAVDLNFEGLLVPVIHQADGLRLRQIAREISGLAGKARAKKLTMDDISGGTVTLTNAGPFGTFITVPVINQPQVAIISTDGVRKKPVVVELPDGTDSIAIHPVGALVMSWDHRAFDGAYAAAFLAAIKQVIETRDWAAEL